MKGQSRIARLLVIVLRERVFGTILVPVEDNAVSLRALATAVSLARALAGGLVLLHVAEPLPTYTSQVALRLPEGELERMAAEYGWKILRNFEAQVPEEVACRTLLRQGHKSVWREILAAAVEEGADLIVIGTHGREGVMRVVLGSVAERVAHHAEVPVMLVR